VSAVGVKQLKSRIGGDVGKGAGGRGWTGTPRFREAEICNAPGGKKTDLPAGKTSKGGFWRCKESGPPWQSKATLKKKETSRFPSTVVSTKGRRKKSWKKKGMKRNHA